MSETISSGKFPNYRPRRMRSSENLRRLVRETHFSLDQLIMPYFVREGVRIKEAIDSMPGQYRFSVDALLSELEEIEDLGIRSILLFGIPSDKDDQASTAWSRDGIVQRAVREIRKNFKDLLVITDVCLCAYTSHGHCGLIDRDGKIDNDSSLRILSDTALSHAEAGAGMVAPSDMMDGRIKAIRERLDQSGLKNIPILSYSAKYASAFYGPFRDAAHSAPSPAGPSLVIPSDRKTYQMDNANLNEALREIAMDIDEGADMVMVKPALAYLDVIRAASQQFSFPLVAYNVSGEYAMIKAAADKGAADEKAVVMEMMMSFFRAGASSVITYHARTIAEWNALESLSQPKADKQVPH